ncbi:unnamed protein product [Clonostachys solani]|uniref:Uncharacterized protein n=1 Tax=Clonostachys solani TaxID=160281 RepID=A0A9N9W4P5_9HYPO|nr:unnamed protein product [Clonostachys solani]
MSLEIRVILNLKLGLIWSKLNKIYRRWSFAMMKMICMRMRKLGHGQSIVFYVPEEIETKVRALRTSNGDSGVDELITVLDVLAWSISETWIDIRRLFPIWAT